LVRGRHSAFWRGKRRNGKPGRQRGQIVHGESTPERCPLRAPCARLCRRRPLRSLQRGAPCALIPDQLARRLRPPAGQRQGERWESGRGLRGSERTRTRQACVPLNESHAETRWDAACVPRWRGRTLTRLVVPIKREGTKETVVATVSVEKRETTMCSSFQRASTLAGNGCSTALSAATRPVRVWVHVWMRCCKTFSEATRVAHAREPRAWNV
jgi:hypothetical protein